MNLHPIDHGEKIVLLICLIVVGLFIFFMPKIDSFMRNGINNKNKTTTVAVEKIIKIDYKNLAI